MSITRSFYANGKLLLTGEYLVMEGARALALPLKVGQHLRVKPYPDKSLIWQASQPEGVWLKAVFSLPDLEIQQTSDLLLAERLKEILNLVFSKSGIKPDSGMVMETFLDFNRAYGFGSSATLISLLSQWSGVDGYWLNNRLFGGSGYDMACATAAGPIMYSLSDSLPVVEPIDFSPPFHDQIYFVYLGHKQQSRKEIEQFKLRKKHTNAHVAAISEISEMVCKAGTLPEFEKALLTHEAIMSEILNRKTVQQTLFEGYNGVVKSLGAWGGDFVLMTTRASRTDFYREMKNAGYTTIYPFADIVMSPPPDYF
ncbi:MAG: hypothetical protein K9G61_06195 [Bacteroidales bacterium]|nr:hypothetical protein [Bacteroidales bacterium]